MRAFLLILFSILPGLTGVLVSGFYVLQDWASLNRAFAHWEKLIRTGGSDRALMVADSYQNAFRINCFADGVGVLLSAILFSIGLLGLCLLPSNGRKSSNQIGGDI
jgi:hypothetical protein